MQAPPPITRLLLIACTVTLFASQIPALWLLMHQWLALHPALSGFWPWQVLTFPILHVNVLNWLFNMMMLYYFGSELEGIWGERRYIQFVLASVLRIPGIYASDREGGRPQDRVRRGTPVLAAGDDGYTNHIHADDLARACIAALWRGRPQRAINVCDDTDMKTGDYYDLVADLSGLPRPARVTRAQAGERFTPAQWSFLNESRRLSNERMKRELRLRLERPTIREGLAD